MLMSHVSSCLEKKAYVGDSFTFISEIRIGTTNIGTKGNF